MNSVALVGRLARDPELTYLQNGNQTAKTTFTLAIDKPRKEDGADFIRVIVFGKQAESANRYLSKGRQCGVTGRIGTGSYKNKVGATVYTTDVVADRVEFMGGRADAEPQPTKELYEETKRQAEELLNNDSFEAAAEDIPF